MKELSDGVECRGCIKRISANHETGERVITITLPQTEAGNVAKLSIYDKIEFMISFKPISAEDNVL